MQIFETKKIAELKENDAFEGFLILKSAQDRVSSSNKHFMPCTLADGSGEIAGVHWDFDAAEFIKTAVGKVVKVRGNVSAYNEALQITISNIRLTDDRDVFDLSQLVPTAPIEVAEATRRINELIKTMKDPDYRKVAIEMLSRHKETFQKIPAARGVHHAFINGLLMHTRYMLESANFFADLYKKVINRDLLLAGTMCHDLAKDIEYQLTGVGLLSDYTAKGCLLGHLVMGAEEIGIVGRELNIPEEKIMLLQHMVLSHHGKPEWGAAVVPQIPEAEVLHMIDNLDATLENYREEFEHMEPGETSDYIRSAGKKYYKHT